MLIGMTGIDFLQNHQVRRSISIKFGEQQGKKQEMVFGKKMERAHIHLPA